MEYVHSTLAFIRQLSLIVKQAESLDTQATYELSLDKATSLLTELKYWLLKVQPTTPPKDLLGLAIAYTLNQWDKLERYVEDGRLGIANNRTERAIKPFVTGRKKTGCSQIVWMELKPLPI